MADQSHLGNRSASLVIADRHPLVLYGLTRLLGSERDFNVVASCQDATSCIETIRDLSPNLALLDIALPGDRGCQVLAAIKSQCLDTRVIYLASASDRANTLRALASGSCGIIPREAPLQLLLHCLRQVASGQNLVSLELKLRDDRDLNTQTAHDDLQIILTARERQIMYLVSEGLSNKEIARRLELSGGTVKVHLHNIYQKLAIHNRTSLAGLATRALTNSLEEAFNTSADEAGEG
jgi:two-component system nitrate/nitrite response regulator NarL